MHNKNVNAINAFSLFLMRFLKIKYAGTDKTKKANSYVISCKSVSAVHKKSGTIFLPIKYLLRYIRPEKNRKAKICSIPALATIGSLYVRRNCVDPKSRNISHNLFGKPKNSSTHFAYIQNAKTLNKIITKW